MSSYCQKCRQKGSFKRDAVLHTHAVDAMDHHAVAELIRKTNTDIVINVGSPFINMSVMDACIETGTHYLDTAIYEDPHKICETPPWYENYEWKKTRSLQKKQVQPPSWVWDLIQVLSMHTHGWVLSILIKTA